MEKGTTKVYRVQGVMDGFGPYSSGLSEYKHFKNAMSYINSFDESHPATSRDPLLAPFFLYSSEIDGFRYSGIVGEYYRHGFRDFNAMLNWFHSCSLDALLAAGYEVVEYVVPVDCVLHGTYQSVFNYNSVISNEVAINSTMSESDRLRIVESLKLT